MVIWWCLASPNLNWYKSYDTKCKIAINTNECSCAKSQKMEMEIFAFCDFRSKLFSCIFFKKECYKVQELTYIGAWNFTSIGTLMIKTTFVFVLVYWTAASLEHLNNKVNLTNKFELTPHMTLIKVSFISDQSICCNFSKKYEICNYL